VVDELTGAVDAYESVYAVVKMICRKRKRDKECGRL
jgi:hypothetical protein